MIQNEAQFNRQIAHAQGEKKLIDCGGLQLKTNPHV